MKLKKGDNVIVITGKDKGKKGKILKVMPKEDRVLVEGVNIKKKHKKPTRDAKGQTIEVSFPVTASNVMLLDPKGSKQTRIGKKVIGGKKVRISRKSGVEI